MSKIENYIQVASSFKPHGIKGSFSLNLINKESTTLQRGSKVFLIPATDKSTILKEGEEHEIESIQYGASKCIFRLVGVDNRNEVESYLPFKVYIERELLPELDDDEVYLEDLVGLDVYEDGEKIGKVFSYYDHGASDILVVKLSDGSKVDLPFVDNFIKDVNLEAKTITVSRPEFL